MLTARTLPAFNAHRTLAVHVTCSCFDTQFLNSETKQYAENEGIFV